MTDKTLAWAIDEIEAAKDEALADKDFWVAKMDDPMVYRDPVLLVAIRRTSRARGARAHAFFDALHILDKVDA